MGQSDSKQTILNETLNNITMKVLSKYGASQTAKITQNNNATITGGAQMKNVAFENIANLDLTMLAGATNNAAMQSELTSQLDAALKANQDAVGKASSDANIHNVVKNVVSVELSTETILEQKFDIEQNNNPTIIGVDPKTGIRTVMVNVKFTNKTDVIAKMVNNVSTGIINALKSDAKASGSAESTQTNPISTAVGAIKDLGISITGAVQGVMTQAISSWGNIAMVFIVMICITVAYMGPEFVLGFIKQVNPMNMLSDDPEPKQYVGKTVESDISNSSTTIDKGPRKTLVGKTVESPLIVAS